MKRKIILASMVIAMGILVFGAISVSAATEGIYTYYISNNKATISDCDESVSGEIVIPNTIGGYPVTSIGNSAFYYCESLTSITIPDSVTSIGEKAFYLCKNLRSINIPDSVTSMGDYAFGSCERITVIIIPSGVTDIGKGVFDGCNYLTSITIPNGVASIGERAFSCCESLQNITIPDSVISIGKGAFDSCHNLESVTIGDSVTSIGAYAFGFCRELNKVNIADLEAWYNIDFSSESSNPLYYGRNLYLNGELVTNLSIPDSVTSIADYAFNGCESITTVTIPDSVTSIGKYAFAYCSSLTSITIEGILTNIGDRVFYACVSLESITIPNSVTSIGSDAFYNCHSLKDVYYNDTADEWDKIAIGSNNEPLINATIHCIQVKYRINDITIKDMSGNSLQAIPTGTFLATVSFTNVSSSEDTLIVLAQYTETGAFKGFMYIQTEDVPTGSTIKLSIPVDNSNGDVVTLKAFCWESFGSVTPMGNSISFPAKQ